MSCVRSTIHTLTDRRKTLFDRIMKKVKININSGCWEWQGGTSGDGRGGGYGRMSVDGHTSAVHIVMYTIFFGYIPGKKQIDHRCNNRICCNPDHLKMVTHKQNQKLRAKRAKEKQ